MLDGNETSPCKDLVPAAIFAGRFQIIELIASGGMSAVYKAQDSVLLKTVALKVLRTRGPNEPNALPRFQREAKAVTLLEHQNIAKIFSFGVEYGEPYIVMEYVNGLSLAELLEQKRRLSVEEIERLFVPLTLALAHAHSNGVVHRDLKPANLVIPRGVDGALLLEQTQIIDFGIAK